MIVEEATETQLRVQLDESLYSEAVVFKCLYWYGGELDISIERARGEAALIVHATPRAGRFGAGGVNEVISRLKRDLVDFKTREIVSRETLAVRELLVAKAFAPTDEFDRASIGSVADLGGIEPFQPGNEEH